MNIFTVLLTQPLANGLALFYKLLGQNMGVAIIAFSLMLRIILNPLTKPYMESMKKMREYSKDLDKLKKKHKGDRSKQMQAQSDFYKEKGINPSAGCLPYLLQIVILIALFNVFNRVLVNGDIATKFNELLYEPLKFAANTSLNTRFLYLDVTKPDVFNIPGFPLPIPGPILIAAAIIQLVSSKISTPYLKAEEKIAKKTKGEADDFQVAMQSSMVYTFPFLTILFGIRFPAGLALYWVLFSLFQLWQQYTSFGWGGATPWLTRLGLIKSPLSNGSQGKK